MIIRTLGQTRDLLEAACRELDADAPDRESQASFLKRVDIATAIERAINLCDSYQAWAEREHDGDPGQHDTWAEHRGER